MITVCQTTRHCVCRATLLDQLIIGRNRAFRERYVRRHEKPDGSDFAIFLDARLNIPVQRQASQLKSRDFPAPIAIR